MGQYESTCQLYLYSELELTLSENGDFSYQLVYFPDTIYGTWKLNGKKLVLTSVYFEEDFIKLKYPGVPKDLIPCHKYPDLPNIDVYKIKKAKLYRIMEAGIDKSCPLIKFADL